MVSYERLPMLEIVFDRLVRLMTTSLRNFTSDNVEVSLDRITSVRFGDYLNSIPLPAILGVFKAEEWDNFGLITVNSSLIYSIIDVLLGGRRGQTAIRIEGRPYTTIETNLVKRMIEVVLADAELAFKPLSPVKFNIDRLETNPRFAAISRPANAAILVRLRIDMEDRGGNVELLLAVRDDRAHPRRAVADVHGREIRPRPDLGRPPRHRDRAGGNRRRRRALRGEAAVEAIDEAERGRNADARDQARCARLRALRRRDPDRGPHGARRRPHGGACRQAVAQAENDARHVRRGGRVHEKEGGHVSYGFGLMIERLVACLLLVTIGYCAMLNHRLKRLRADEQAMKATIAELITATEIAERAVEGLQAAVRDSDAAPRAGEQRRAPER